MIYELTTILQNSGIRLCFYAIVRHCRMPPMDRENIGGISTGLSSYSERVCRHIHKMRVSPIVRRLLAYHVSQLLYSYLKECDI